MNLNEMTFEQAFERLEEIVAQLESGELSLDESVALYEEGQKLARRCGKLLDAAELRIQQVDEAGNLEPLD